MWYVAIETNIYSKKGECLITTDRRKTFNSEQNTDSLISFERLLNSKKKTIQKEQMYLKRKKDGRDRPQHAPSLEQTVFNSKPFNLRRRCNIIKEN